MYTFYYGIDTDKIDVTLLVLSRCAISKDVLYIPENCESLFMDHLIGTNKFFYIQQKNVMNKYHSCSIYINIKEENIYFGENIELPVLKTLYTAVIVEPRCHKALHFVLNNICENLSDEWSILLCIGTQNVKYVHKILKKLSYHLHRIRLYQMNVSNLTIPEYNQLFVTTPFYSWIPTETFLVFQTDSMILNKQNIRPFLKYDYVGAPWTDGVGNGGFSLRKKSKMLEIIATVPYQNEPEDVYFCKQTMVPLYQPSVEEAKLFSVESLFYPKPFGIHKVWQCSSCNEMQNLYPLVNTLKQLQ